MFVLFINNFRIRMITMIVMTIAEIFLSDATLEWEVETAPVDEVAETLFQWADEIQCHYHHP